MSNIYNTICHKYILCMPLQRRLSPAVWNPEVKKQPFPHISDFPYFLQERPSYLPPQPRPQDKRVVPERRCRNSLSKPLRFWPTDFIEAWRQLGTRYCCSRCSGCCCSGWTTRGCCRCCCTTHREGHDWNHLHNPRCQRSANRVPKIHPVRDARYALIRFLIYRLPGPLLRYFSLRYASA